MAEERNINLWDACEQVGRQKRGLGPEYTICAIDLSGERMEHQSSDWVEAHIKLGIRHPKTGRQKWDHWTDLVKVVVYPIDVAGMVEA